MLRLKRANIQPKKPVMDNEISWVMKVIIRDQYQLELVPPGCHRRNTAEVAIHNFKAHFFSILAGTADIFPCNCGTDCCYKPRSQWIPCANLMRYQKCQHIHTWVEYLTKENSTETHGMQRAGPQENRHMWHMGIPLSGRMISGNITRTVLHT